MIKLRILIFLFLYYIFHKCKNLDAVITKPEASSVCSNAACTNAASIIQHYMNPLVDPCDDFYQFACGNFLKQASIPQDKGRLDRYDIVLSKIQGQLKSSLEEPSKPNEPRWLRLTKNLYKACMDTTAIEKIGLQAVLSDFEQLGGWPVVKGKSWNSVTFDWKSSTYKMMALGYGASYFFQFKVITDDRNRTKRILTIAPPDLSIDRENLIKGPSDKIVTAYHNYTVDMAVMFGANRTTAEDELKGSLAFEIQLANISVSEKSKRMTVHDLSKNYPTIPWRVYFNSILAALKPSFVIDDNETIIVSAPTFFKNFEALINRTQKRDQANYHLWKAAQDDFNYMNDKVRKRQLQFQNFLSGKAEKLPIRWKECLGAASGLLAGSSVGALYVRKYFNLEYKKSAENLIHDVEKEYQKSVQEATWMDDKSRSDTLKRLASINNFIAFPYELLDDKALNGFYERVEITPNGYFEATANVSIFNDGYFYNLLRTPINISSWTIHSEAASVEPSYSLVGLGPEIPAGILQDMFYDMGFPGYMNYGGIGSIDMGHEITHHLDNIDAFLTPETKIEYLKKADCITQQYGNYTVKEVGLKVNGAMNRLENINDNSGVRIAYRAYQNWAKQNGPEPKLPGLEKYTQSQVFWINVAIQKCTAATKDYLKQYVLTNVHSPPEFRVIGTLSNRPEFARDFNCKRGAKMNPDKKCSVW